MPSGTAPLFVGTNGFVPAPHPLTALAWSECRRLLEAEHAALHDPVALVDPATLDRPAPGGSMTPGMLSRGIALHDIYHAGQIPFMKAALRGDQS